FAAIAAMEAETTPVRQQHLFNVQKLQQYLSSRLHLAPDASAISVLQYSSGQSNPTFFIQTPERSYVLRKKPPGPLLPGAHKVDREYAVQKALHSAAFPVPQPVLYCSDTDVIGTEFYIMEHVKGRIFRDLKLPGLSAAERSALYVAAVETLARLHSVDVASLGLAGYGKGAGYSKRQVSTWTKQYRASAHRSIPAMDELSDWLSNNLPSGDNEVTLVHGDFRIDNLIFHPTEARVLAVLDWELSTTGQPTADLAYFLMPHYCPSHLGVISTLGGVTEIEGIPPPGDLISIYCRCRGLPPSLPHQNFFIALAMFKMASIAQVPTRDPRADEVSDCFIVFEMPCLRLCGVYLFIFWCSSSLSMPGSDRRFLQSPRGHAVLQQVKEFMRQHVLPAQQVSPHHIEINTGPGVVNSCWLHLLCSKSLQAKARAAGLWNLFLPAVSGLSQVDYSYIAEETGRCFFAPEVFNCQAPDSGNMEVLHLYGSEEQKKQWLEPLLRGEMRSCFCMTEPDVASSDATNMQCTLQKDNGHYIINGKKWWSSGAGNSVCKIAVVMCRNKTADPNNRHGQHSMILVPMDTPGVRKIRALTVFGADDAHHGGHLEVHFDNVRVPASNILLGEGRGFEIAQGRLGPGRLHHCMRAVGLAEHALELLCQRSASRQTFGKELYHHEVVAHWIAESRIAIEQTRLLALHAAHTLDTKGNKAARKQIGMIKVAAGRMATKVVDCAIQVHGGAGVSDDFPLAQMYAYARTLRLADGPDEVHLSSIAQMELRDQLRRTAAKL
uniref:Acyl-CoA dehydrogenase family member 11 n=1 Tax=Pygocentrus nattereri TaxID=42514 RepID=A0AAR2KWK9_PYGNA